MGSQVSARKSTASLIAAAIFVIGAVTASAAAASVPSRPAQAAAAGRILTWSAPRTVDGSHQMSGISCPTASLCLAADRNGNIVTMVKPAKPGAHHVVHISDVALAGVSCATKYRCVALDKQGYVYASKDPGSTRAGAWHRIAADTSGLGNYQPNGISCTNSHHCMFVTGGGDFVTGDPTSGGWTVVHSTTYSGYPLAVGCWPGGQCVATDQSGDVITGGAPDAGGTVTNIDGTHAINAISCRNSHLCVAVDDVGNVLTSTHPLAGAGAWHRQSIHTYVLLGVSCASTTLCAAGGLQGSDKYNLFASNTPTDARRWQGALVRVQVNAVSCPTDHPPTMCAAVTNDGRVVVGSVPPVAPTTKITQRPVRHVTTRHPRVTVTFRFSGTPSGVTFQCKLDSRPYAACASPEQYRLKAGAKAKSHTFRVRALNRGRPDPTPAGASFTVRRTT